MLKRKLLITATLLFISPVFIQVNKLTPVYAQRVQDIQGWNNTRWGMTYEQVKTLYPSIGNLEIIATGRSEFSHYAIIESIQIEGFIYRIYFHFSGRQLESVTLYDNSTESISYLSILSTVSSLTRKYGPSSLIPGDSITKRRWDLPTTKVTFGWDSDSCTDSRIRSIIRCRTFLVYRRR
jgi:hypothetical protein